MNKIFLGKLGHWAFAVVIGVVLAVVGYFHVHVTWFNYFVFIILGLSAIGVCYVVFGYREGDRVMRESLDQFDEDPDVSVGSE